jgi:hypothetical protein
MSSDVLTLGRGKTTRYGLPKSILGRPAQQPLFWVDEAGTANEIGLLSFLAGNWIHVDGPLVQGLVRGELPWFLLPLRPKGFLGRLLAQRLSVAALGADPDFWDVESALFAALTLRDAPGAIVLGEPPTAAMHAPLPANPEALLSALDALSADVAKTLPVGWYAGGEQPKFIAIRDSGEHVLVKFTPPRGTPFGERWHDLLVAEALACEVLASHGVEVARCETLHSPTRTYLVSTRFDRIGASGRRHVVSLGAAHAAFVAGGYSSWAQSCDALVRQRRLDRTAADQARALMAFGHLIGNIDMHSGNLGLLVKPEDLVRGRFSLAPVYDMLPMRWRPDPVHGGVADYSAFEPDALSLASGARAPATDFWLRLAEHASVSKPLRTVAKEMAARLA